jgi:hypothetical protein
VYSHDLEQGESDDRMKGCKKEVIGMTYFIQYTHSLSNQYLFPPSSYPLPAPNCDHQPPWQVELEMLKRSEGQSLIVPLCHSLSPLTSYRHLHLLMSCPCPLLWLQLYLMIRVERKSHRFRLRKASLELLPIRVQES